MDFNWCWVLFCTFQPGFWLSLGNIYLTWIGNDSTSCSRSLNPNWDMGFMKPLFRQSLHEVALSSKVSAIKQKKSHRCFPFSHRIFNKETDMDFLALYAMLWGVAVYSWLDWAFGGEVRSWAGNWDCRCGSKMASMACLAMPVSMTLNVGLHGLMMSDLELFHSGI